MVFTLQKLPFFLKKNYTFHRQRVIKEQISCDASVDAVLAMVDHGGVVGMSWRHSNGGLNADELQRIVNHYHIQV
jgi:hypothetical protein